MAGFYFDYWSALVDGRNAWKVGMGHVALPIVLVVWRLNSFTVWWGNGAWRTNQPRPCCFVMVTKQ